MKQQYVNLGLPSGTLWATENEQGLYTFDEAIGKFGNNLPSVDDWNEVVEYTTQEWDDERKGMWFISKKDPCEKMFLPAAGIADGGNLYGVDTDGYYWSSTYDSNDYAHHMIFFSWLLDPSASYHRSFKQSVRLIKH